MTKERKENPVTKEHKEQKSVDVKSAIEAANNAANQGFVSGVLVGLGAGLMPTSVRLSIAEKALNTLQTLVVSRTQVTPPEKK